MSYGTHLGRELARSDPQETDRNCVVGSKKAAGAFVFLASSPRTEWSRFRVVMYVCSATVHPCLQAGNKCSASSVRRQQRSNTMQTAEPENTLVFVSLEFNAAFKSGQVIMRVQKTCRFRVQADIKSSQHRCSGSLFLLRSRFALPQKASESN